MINRTPRLASTVIVLALTSLPAVAQSTYEPYTFTTFAGVAPSSAASPTGVAVDRAGNLYVPDNNTIRKISPAGTVTTLAGLAGTAGTADGTGSAARFSFFSLVDGGVAVDSGGSVYVTDGRIRKITPAGVVTTLAAPPWVRSSGIAVDSAGNLYVAEKYDNTILKITSAGGVTTLAGLAGTEGSQDGAGSDARFSRPTGVAVDALGNVYVADAWNATIRKVTPAGVVTTLAGLAGSSGTADGTGSAARFGWRGCCGDGPSGVAVDYFGNVYVTDTENNMIRKVTPAGVVTTLAGLGHEYDPGGSTDGTGSDARFARPFGIAVDSSGTLYVVDSRNNMVRKGSPALLITASGQDFGLDAGHVGLRFPGQIGKSVIVEGSTDLMSWLPLWTNTFGSALKFSDPQNVFSKRFYRARLP